MKAKLLRDAGEISEGTDVEIASRAGTNEDRSDENLGGRGKTVAPVYEVTDTEGHAEKVDTRDLKPLPQPGSKGYAGRRRAGGRVGA